MLNQVFTTLSSVTLALRKDDIDKANSRLLYDEMFKKPAGLGVKRYLDQNARTGKTKCCLNNHGRQVLMHMKLKSWMCSMCWAYSEETTFLPVVNNILYVSLSKHMKLTSTTILCKFTIFQIRFRLQWIFNLHLTLKNQSFTPSTASEVP